MKCKFCSADVDSGVFCPYCGNKLESPTSSSASNNHVGNWVVAILKDTEDNSYYGYDSYTEVEVGPLRSHDKCLKQLTKDVQEALVEADGLGNDENPSSEEDYAKDSYVRKLVNKGYEVEYCYIDVVYKEDEIEAKYGDENDEFEDEFDDEFDDEDDEFEYGHVGSGSVYAVLRKSALFYEGEIPGMSFGKVNFAHSRQECIDELKEAYRKYAGGMFDKTSTYNLSKIKSRYRSWEIIKIA